jgi:adenylate cyclase
MISIYRALGREAEVIPASKIAAEVCENWLASNPDDLRARYLGAGAYATLGNVERSKQWLDIVMSAAPNDPPVLYNTACVYAMLGEDDRCLDALERAVGAGFSHRSWIENDGDLYRLHNHPRYRALLEKLPGSQS